VRCIVLDFAAGHSLCRVAHELNAEGSPGAVDTDGDTNLRRQPKRHIDLLNNTLYIGRLS
jgi:hypothetical protein